MKYTVSGSTLQYKVGLTLSFLSLISRGVGGIQKGNTSIPANFDLVWVVKKKKKKKKKKKEKERKKKIFSEFLVINLMLS
jgi:hypothetical protein